ncbi:unnamed protein product [Amoebophrya sp. A120]|nr:unnamed protein product [Amoebophrya sp. A120]|eukprot:GSA120T00007286001.1
MMTHSVLRGQNNRFVRRASALALSAAASSSVVSASSVSLLSRKKTSVRSSAGTTTKSSSRITRKNDESATTTSTTAREDYSTKIVLGFEGENKHRAAAARTSEEMTANNKPMTTSTLLQKAKDKTTVQVFTEISSKKQSFASQHQAKMGQETTQKAEAKRRRRSRGSSSSGRRGRAAAKPAKPKPPSYDPEELVRCPWLEGSSRDGYLECNDGSLQQVRGGGWNRCQDRGGRKRCPKNQPVMCAKPNDCVGGTDYCCKDSAWECHQSYDHGELRNHWGPRGCPAAAASTSTPKPATTTPKPTTSTTRPTTSTPLLPTTTQPTTTTPLPTTTTRPTTSTPLPTTTQPTTSTPLPTSTTRPTTSSTPALPTTTAPPPTTTTPKPPSTAAVAARAPPSAPAMTMAVPASVPEASPIEGNPHCKALSANVPKANAVNLVLLPSNFAHDDFGDANGNGNVWADKAQTVFQGLSTYAPFDAANNAALNVFYVNQRLDEEMYAYDNDGDALCWYGCHDVDRLLCCVISEFWKHAEMHCGSGFHTTLLVIHNSPKYGGAGYAAQSAATMSLDNAALQIAAHELGHAMFGLGDEYSQGTATPDTKPNCEFRKSCERNLSGSEGLEVVYRPQDITQAAKFPTTAAAALQSSQMHVPACAGHQYYTASVSIMAELDKPWGMANLRLTCCKWYLLNEGIPEYCIEYDQFGLSLHDFCHHVRVEFDTSLNIWDYNSFAQIEDDIDVVDGDDIGARTATGSRRKSTLSSGASLPSSFGGQFSGEGDDRQGGDLLAQEIDVKERTSVVSLDEEKDMQFSSDLRQTGVVENNINKNNKATKTRNPTGSTRTANLLKKPRPLSLLQKSTEAKLRAELEAHEKRVERKQQARKARNENYTAGSTLETSAAKTKPADETSEIHMSEAMQKNFLPLIETRTLEGNNEPGLEVKHILVEHPVEWECVGGRGNDGYVCAEAVQLINAVAEIEAQTFGIGQYLSNLVHGDIDCDHLDDDMLAEVAEGPLKKDDVVKIDVFRAGGHQNKQSSSSTGQDEPAEVEQAGEMKVFVRSMCFFKFNNVEQPPPTGADDHLDHHELRVSRKSFPVILQRGETCAQSRFDV